MTSVRLVAGRERLVRARNTAFAAAMSSGVSGVMAPAGRAPFFYHGLGRAPAATPLDPSLLFGGWRAPSNS